VNGDRVLIALPTGQWLALDRQTFDAALIAGAEYMVPTAPATDTAANTGKLVTAETLSELTGVPATWFEAQARERRIPFRKLGRYVRFDFEELMSCDAFKRRAVPAGQMNCTGLNDRKLGVRV
jgi:hypothetical protein